MSKKPKASSANAGSKSDATPSQYERLMAKRQYKDAVREAKILFKADSSPEHRRMLERAYLARAGQLRLANMPSSAIEVCGHLLEFGLTDETLRDEFANLLMGLGMARQAFAIQGTLETPEAKNKLSVMSADVSVLHPERSKGMDLAIAREAVSVREAIEALARRDEASALALVRDLPRNSPLADWKLFIRGLAAYYRREEGEARANWSRLDPERPASAIARRLQSLVPRDASDDSTPSEWEALERQVLGEPVLARLREIRTLLGKREWAEILRRVPSLRQHLRAIEPALAEELTRALIGPLYKHALELDSRSGPALIRDFTKAAQPLAIDPRWNRLWGLIWEATGADPDTAADHLTRYVADIDTAPGFNAEDRPLAKALVLNHLARLHCDTVDEDEEDEDFDEDFDDDRRSSRSKGRRGYPPRQNADMRKAIECLERSLELAPGLRETYEILLDAYEEWGELKKLEQTAQRTLQKFPEDFEALVLLAEQSYKKGDGAAAIDYILRARKHKPLDQDLIRLEAAIRQSLARNLALSKRWEDGRKHYAAVETTSPGEGLKLNFLARRFAFEIKAGDRARAEAIEKRALDRLEEPTPWWLAVYLECAAFKFSKTLREPYHQLLKDGLTKKCRSETSGALAAVMKECLNSEVGLTGLKGAQEDVVAYLSRTSRVKFRLEDLEEVIDFFAHLKRVHKMLEKLVKRGLKEFPNSAVVRFYAGINELQKGPPRWRPEVANEHLEAALKIAESSSKPLDRELLPRMKEGLRLLKELIEQSRRWPFGGFSFSFGPGAGKGAAFEDLFDMFDGPDDDDEFDDEFDPGAGPRTKPPPKGPGGRKSSPRPKKP